MTKKRGKNKRAGSKFIQTKRSPKNKHKWEKQVGYATRQLQRDKYFNKKVIRI